MPHNLKQPSELKNVYLVFYVCKRPEVIWFSVKTEKFSNKDYKCHCGKANNVDGNIMKFLLFIESKWHNDAITLATSHERCLLNLKYIYLQINSFAFRRVLYLLFATFKHIKWHRRNKIKWRYETQKSLSFRNYIEKRRRYMFWYFLLQIKVGELFTPHSLKNICKSYVYLTVWP